MITYVVSMILAVSVVYMLLKTATLKRSKAFLTSSFPFVVFGFDVSSQYKIGVKKLKLKGKNSNMTVPYNRTLFITDTSIFVEEIKAKAREMIQK